MKKINKIIKLIIIITICIFMFLSPLVMNLSANYVDDAYVIDNYSVEVYVNEDGTLDINEKLDTTFFKTRHGIYLQYPTRYNMYFNDEYKDYRFPITNKKVLSDHEYEINNYDSNVEFKLGSPDYYANEKETYNISYTIVTNNLNFDDYSLFYQNLLYEATSLVNNFNFKIHFDKDIDPTKLEFYIGNSEDNLNQLDYTYTNTNGEYILEGNYSGKLLPYESFTIYTKLPKDYYNYPDNNIYYILLCIISFLIVGFLLIKFYKYGKDDDVVVTVEFSAPENMSSAEVGYIVDGCLDTRDVTSLIIEWAKNGFLTITESNDELVFDKVKELPDTYPMFQKLLFSALFESGDSVSTSSLKYVFADAINECKLNIYKYYKTNKRRLYYSNSLKYQILCGILSLFPLTSFLLLVGYTKYNLSLSLLALGPSYLLLLVTFCVFKSFENKKNTYSKFKYIIMIIFAIIPFYFQFKLVNKYINTFDDINIIYLYIIEIITLILIFLTSIMNKKTPMANRWYGQVLGLRNFIIYTEKDRLDLLLKDDPQLFYNILPYAYAFGISDIWQEHFKDLTFDNPSWYISNNNLSNYYLISSMNRNFSTMTSTIAAPKPSQRSSGGFSGGGGGFSGGGFGGGSVGSW